MVKIFVYEIHNDCSFCLHPQNENATIENAFLTKYVPMYILKKEGALITGNSFLVRLLYPKVMDFYFKICVSFFNF